MDEDTGRECEKTLKVRLRQIEGGKYGNPVFENRGHLKFISGLRHIGSYLGTIRNAADHGPDPDINNASWQIRDATGLEYVFVACSFIAATLGIEKTRPT
jgi:hypothetical protein